MLLAFICTTLSGEEQKAAGMVPLFRGKKREGKVKQRAESPTLSQEVGFDGHRHTFDLELKVAQGMTQD